MSHLAADTLKAILDANWEKQLKSLSDHLEVITLGDKNVILMQKQAEDEYIISELAEENQSYFTDLGRDLFFKYYLLCVNLNKIFLGN